MDELVKLPLDEIWNTCSKDHKKNQDKFKTNRQYWERLGFLQIINKALEETYKQSDEEISVAPVPATTNNNKQAVMPKNIVLDSGWFDSDQTKFEDWWREIWLFFKSNRVIETNDRIIAILACLRGAVADIYT